MFDKINSLCGKQFFLVAKKTRDAFGGGVVKAKNGFLQEIIEKPPSHSPGLLNTSIARVPASIFSILKKTRFSPRGEIEATDAYTALAKKQKIRVILFNGFWSDVGTMREYKKANAWVLKNGKKM